MICPVCKTRIQEEYCTEACPQCGSDLKIHQLLKNVQREVTTDKSETIENSHTRCAYRGLTLLQLSHGILTFFIATLVALSLFIGYHFIVYFNRHEVHQDTALNQWSKISTRQLSQMNSTVKRTLTLIIAEHKENQHLRARIDRLTQQLTRIRKQQSQARLRRQKQKDRTLHDKIQTLNSEIHYLKKEINNLLTTTKLPRP